MHNDDSQFRTMARGGAIFLVLLGTTVLLGWFFDSSFLKTLLPGQVTMKANTAIGFICGGVALAFLLRSESSRKLRCLASLASVLTLVIGIFTLIEYLFHRDLKIDQL